MASLVSTNSEAQENLDDEIQELQLSLPKETWFVWPMYLYHGLWCLNYILENMIAFKTHFQAYDTDIILASLPKTGTTWLKSLIFSIVNRKKISDDFAQHPFHTKNPHELIEHLEHLETSVYKKVNGDKQHYLSEITLPRLFATHMSYLSLPDSIKTSKCRIVYVCRNPFDTFVSMWHFFLKFEACKDIKPDVEMMEKYVGKFCSGVSPWGPYEDHVLGYWKKSNQNPQKVLFLEYEGLKTEPEAHLKRLAEFVGYPFSEFEEKDNVINKILELCGLKSLREMDVNKIGRLTTKFENKILFRKGEVGDWTNYLTPSMGKRIEEMQEKLNKAGFSSSYY